MTGWLVVSKREIETGSGLEPQFWRDDIFSRDGKWQFPLELEILVGIQDRRWLVRLLFDVETLPIYIRYPVARRRNIRG